MQIHYCQTRFPKIVTLRFLIKYLAVSVHGNVVKNVFLEKTNSKFQSRILRTNFPKIHVGGE